jgi:DNA polymerase
MAACLTVALPSSLKDASAALNLPIRKDMEGQRLMLKMAKPRKARSDEDPRGGPYWHDESEKQSRLQRYCIRDVEVERAASKAVPPLTADEQALWELDARINEHGFYTDGVLLDAARRVVIQADRALQTEFSTLTGLNSTNQIDRFIAWLAEHHCDVTDIQKGTLKNTLRRKDLAPEARRAIELRLQLAHASATKVNALLAWRGADGRVRGTFQFHGAGTGRWSGHGPQPHNFKRDGEGTDTKIAAILAGGARLDSPVEAVGDTIRAMVCAAPGHRLFIGDFSGIESRVLAWAAEEQSKIDLWKQFDETGDPDDDPYVTNGRDFGHPESTVRAYGKIGDLAFGFGGGVGSWKNFAPEDDDADETKIKQYRDAWRQRHPQTKRFWRQLDYAATHAIRHPGVTFSANRFPYRYEAPFLQVELPSGRSISYPFAEIMPEPDRYGKPRATFLDNARGKFEPCNFGHGAWSGIWCENVVSGVARDLLAAAMRRLKAAGYQIVLHVHDEIVCEVPDGFSSLEEFHRLLTTLPDWAGEDLPIAAKVREGERFSKPAGEPKTSTGELGDGESGARTVEDDEGEDLPDDDTTIDDGGRPQPAATMEREVAEPTTAPPWMGSGSPETELTSDQQSSRGNGGATTNEDFTNMAGAGNGYDRHARQRGNGKWSNYHDHETEENADKPYAPIRARLLAKGYRVARTFAFTLPGGKELCFEDRYELRPEIAPSKDLPHKTSRFWHHNDSGEELNGTGPRRIIYNWSAIMAAGPGVTVYITEGANKSVPLIETGRLATAVPYHQWGPECVNALAGYHLIYLQDHCNPLLGLDAHDNDPAALYADDARKKLAPGAASFRIVPAAYLWKYLPVGTRPIQLGDDVKDWLELGGDPAKLLEICREIPADGITISAEPYRFPEEQKIAPWQWLYGRHLLRGEISGTAAMGGTGKSTLSIVEALAMASGRQLLGQEVPKPLRVVLINLEDTRNTMDKRIVRGDAAIRAHRGRHRRPSDRQGQGRDQDQGGEAIAVRRCRAQRADHRRADQDHDREQGRRAVDRQLHPYPQSARERQHGNRRGNRVLRDDSRRGTMCRAPVAPYPQGRRREGDRRIGTRRHGLHRWGAVGPDTGDDVGEGAHRIKGGAAGDDGARLLLPQL